MTQAQALDALARDGKLIKRPVVLGAGFALVGFDESAYRARFRRDGSLPPTAQNRS